MNRAKHEDIGGHQHGIIEQPHGNAEIGVFPGLLVRLGCRLVRVDTVHQPLGSVTAENPVELGDFRDIRLAIKHRPLGVQAQSQPGGGNFLAGLAHLCRVLALDKRVIVRKKEKRLRRRVPGGGNGRTNGTDKIAQVRRTGGGNAGENALCCHEFPINGPG